jgi:elongation factor Ts
MSITISAQDVKSLRDRTGAGIMDAKAALQESGGDVDKAIEILRVKGQASAAKRGERTASEGTVATYIHAGGQIGALVEVDCETDFVARTEEFQALRASPRTSRRRSSRAASTSGSRRSSCSTRST